MALVKCMLCVLVAVSLIKSSRSFVLCDGGCINGTGLGICSKNTSSDDHPLYFMGFFPCNVPGFRARGLTVAGQMAVRAVTLNSSLLQGYRVELSFGNSMCDRIRGVRAFIDQLREEATLGLTRHMIIGPGCSTGAITIAETAPFYNLTQIAYTATSITLSDKRRFPTFLRTISSDNASIAIMGVVIQEFRWEQVAIVTLRNEVFMNLTGVMVEAFTNQGVRVVTERLFFNAPSSGDINVYEDIILQLNTSGARIVLLNVFEDSARELFCQAYLRGMMFPRYLFISYYWFSQGWWLDPIDTCTPNQLKTVINNSIAIYYFPEALSSELDSPTDVGMTPNEFLRYYRGNISSLGYPDNEALPQGMYVYDAVWAAAFALDDVDQQLKAGVIPGRSSLRDFSYAEGEINRLIYSSARNRKFRGVSGKISINEFGDREPFGEIYQYIFNEQNDDTTFEPFATVNLENNNVDYVNGQSEDTIFPGGVPRAAEDVYVNLALFSIMTILSVAGIIFAIFCIIFNLTFRKKQIVKLTSPYINILIIIGAIFFYVDVILFGIDERLASFAVVDGLCQARIWISSIGFSLLFGPILVKAFRVYYIFRSVKLKKKPLKDWILLLIVAVMVVFDVFFLIIVSVDEWRLSLNVLLIIRNNGQIPAVIDQCSSDAALYWMPVLLSYKAVYLIVGLFLASQTFNVKIKKLRDSKLIVASVYETVIASVILAVSGLFLTNSPTILYLVIGFFISFFVTSVLCLLFVPRVIELCKDPSGEVQLDTAPTKTVLGGASQENISAEDRDKIAELKNTISSLKSELKRSQEKISAGDLNSKGSQSDLLLTPDHNNISKDRDNIEKSENPSQTVAGGCEMSQVETYLDVDDSKLASSNDVSAKETAADTSC